MSLAPRFTRASRARSVGSSLVRTSCSKTCGSSVMSRDRMLRLSNSSGDDDVAAQSDCGTTAERLLLPLLWWCVLCLARLWLFSPVVVAATEGSAAPVVAAAARECYAPMCVCSPLPRVRGILCGGALLLKEVCVCGVRAPLCSREVFHRRRGEESES